jgi:hypothetical protein
MTDLSSGLVSPSRNLDFKSAGYFEAVGPGRTCVEAHQRLVVVMAAAPVGTLPRSVNLSAAGYSRAVHPRSDVFSLCEVMSATGKSASPISGVANSITSQVVSSGGYEGWILNREDGFIIVGPK